MNIEKRGLHGKNLIWFFGLPFLGVGAAMGAGLVYTLLLWRSAYYSGGDLSGQGLFNLILLVFTMAFSIAGGLFSVHGWSTDKARRREVRLRDPHPQEPWYWREDWLQGRARAVNESGIWYVVVAAVIWNAIAWPTVVLVFEPLLDRLSDGKLGNLVFPVFLLVGIWLAVWAITAVLQWRRFGKAELALQQTPGLVGGCLDGTLELPARLKAEQGVLLQLSCLRELVKGDENNIRVSTSVLWQDSYVVGPDSVRSETRVGSSLPVHFRIPDGCVPTDVEDPKDRIYWQLDCTADLPGPDLRLRFDVPVFRTALSMPDTELSDDQRRGAGWIESEEGLTRALGFEGIVFETLHSGGKRFVFQRARRKGMAVGITAGMLYWSAMCVFLWLNASFGFGFVFTLLDLYLIHLSMEMWFRLRSVTATSKGLTVLSRRLKSVPEQHFSVGEVKQFYVSQGMRSGNKLNFRVMVEFENERNLLLGSLISNRRLADQIAAELQSGLELKY